VFNLFGRKDTKYVLEERYIIKSPGGSMSTGVIFILGKGGSPILASGVKSTWPQGSSAPGFSRQQSFEKNFFCYLKKNPTDE
ncbi:hypothetical protein, partial [Paramuribaculum intestinale]|uniref:hypothetical protein n=1 Tax=Paramuribaculum intestinale TaxID=2094151 RepID=UPI0025A98E57